MRRLKLIEYHATGDVEGGNFLFDVVAIDPQTAWAIKIGGYVIKTVNGEKTWQEVSTGAPKVSEW